MPQLSADATIADIMSSLAQPETYLRRVIGTFYEMKKIHGEVMVRIGITGQGKMPHYRMTTAAAAQFKLLTTLVTLFQIIGQ